MMYSSDSSRLLYIYIYIIHNRSEISALREYRLQLWSFISVFLMYRLLMACCKAETHSWAIYTKIYVVLDGCRIWIYCFSACNTTEWITSSMLNILVCLWNLPCWAHRQQGSHPSGPKGVDFMFVFLFFYTHWQVQPASETGCLKKKERVGVWGSCMKSHMCGSFIKQLCCKPCRRHSVYCELERDPIEEKLCCPFHLPEHLWNVVAHVPRFATIPFVTGKFAQSKCFKFSLLLD